MSEKVEQQQRRGRWLLIGGGLAAAAVLGGLVARATIPASRPGQARSSRPIVQIVRQQPGLPDLSDVIARLCPSVAVVVPHGGDPADPAVSGSEIVPAFAVSADGWLLASAASLPQGQLDAVFGDGARAGLSDVRTDPVSGLAIAKAAQAGPPLAFNDQGVPRVGQFGFALETPVGNGCSANTAMVGSDFLADGAQSVGYIRVQSDADPWTGGMPFLGTDGRLLGVSTADPPGALIPASSAAVIVDELIRNQLSPSTAFGFRTVDYGAAMSARLGDVRSGAGVSLVKAKSPAARAGLRAGDVVVAVNDVPVSSASELNRALDAQPRSAVLTVQRGPQQVKLTVQRISS